MNATGLNLLTFYHPPADHTNLDRLTIRFMAMAISTIDRLVQQFLDIGQGHSHQKTINNVLLAEKANIQKTPISLK